MARSREDLHEYLCEILRSRHVYFRAPESNKMEYPAIKYDLAKLKKRSANNSPYIITPEYEITLIDYDPDSEFVKALSSIPLCIFDRTYVANNLNHWVFTLSY